MAPQGWSVAPLVSGLKHDALKVHVRRRPMALVCEGALLATFEYNGAATQKHVANPNPSLGGVAVGHHFLHKHPAGAALDALREHEAQRALECHPEGSARGLNARGSSSLGTGTPPSGPAAARKRAPSLQTVHSDSPVRKLAPQHSPAWVLGVRGASASAARWALSASGTESSVQRSGRCGESRTTVRDNAPAKARHTHTQGHVLVIVIAGATASISPAH